MKINAGSWYVVSDMRIEITDLDNLGNPDFITRPNGKLLHWDEFIEVDQAVSWVGEMIQFPEVRAVFIRRGDSIEVLYRKDDHPYNRETVLIDK